MADPEQHLQAKDRLESGAWSVRDIVKEFFELSGNFKDYLHGLVKISTSHTRAVGQRDLIECTFQPKVNALSAKIDQRAN